MDTQRRGLVCHVHCFLCTVDGVVGFGSDEQGYPGAQQGAEAEGATVRGGMLRAGEEGRPRGLEGAGDGGAIHDSLIHGLIDCRTIPTYGTHNTVMCTITHTRGIQGENHYITVQYT